ncbi:hypothetical protein LY632_00115 [Erythrobacter sp. SDW2]|uniref:CC_3452 family protein n=1 Tax=Erythrobacter sp. SDW2 TaxID=2907154 RepID=UPI001F440CFE|nr:hypothetical protein [Erythrobacter sp. SDW2]UIP06841.1 hypothetical protein LY632_00115 [Erythrobacter sp. SDW2]
MSSFAHTARNASIGTLALVYTALTFSVAAVPTPAEAADTAPYYRAELAQPVEAGIEIVRGTAWSCKGTVCVANKGNSRPAIICQRLADKKGEIVSFKIEGEALPAEDLAKCQGRI